MWSGHSFQALFNFQRMQSKKESEKASMLIWTNFHSFAIKYLNIKFLMEVFILEYDIKWPNFIYRLCLLPKLFSKMYLLFYAQAFDDVMKFEYLKF